MGQYERHEPREIEISGTDANDWLQENKGLVNHEVLTATEKFIYDNSTEPVVALILHVNGEEYELHGESLRVLSLSIVVSEGEIEYSLENINKWAIDNEEYEMCQRIKNLNDYIQENELQFTTESDV